MPSDGSGGDVALRVVVLLVPIVVTARVLSLWLPDAIACAMSTSVWMFSIYWFPSRVQIPFKRWLLIVFFASVAAFLLTKLFGWF